LILCDALVDFAMDHRHQLVILLVNPGLVARRQDSGSLPRYELGWGP
jgi:hypothetical protein